MLAYLSDSRYQDEPHIIGRAKLLIYLSDQDALKEIAKVSRIDYYSLFQIQQMKKDIKDLSADAIYYLNIYYLTARSYYHKANNHHK